MLVNLNLVGNVSSDLAQLPVQLLEAAEEGEAPWHHVAALGSLLALVLASASPGLTSEHLDHPAPAAVLARGPAHVHIVSVAHILDVLGDAGVCPGSMLVREGNQLAINSFS